MTHALKKINKEKQDQKENIYNSDLLKVKRIDKDDDTEVRIVIIGESVRRDYMYTYGYEIRTTPFLDSTNGIFIDGMVSAAPNTKLSLDRHLFKTYPEKK